MSDPDMNPGALAIVTEFPLIGVALLVSMFGFVNDVPVSPELVAIWASFPKTICFSDASKNVYAMVFPSYCLEMNVLFEDNAMYSTSSYAEPYLIETIS